MTDVNPLCTNRFFLFVLGWSLYNRGYTGYNSQEIFSLKFVSVLANMIQNPDEIPDDAAFAFSSILSGYAVC